MSIAICQSWKDGGSLTEANPNAVLASLEAQMTFVLHERAERTAPDRQGKVYADTSQRQP